MSDFQVWLEGVLGSVDPVATLMRTKWAWPIAESLHFIGLTLLFGSIAAWDLRLLGIAKRAPIIAFHQLVPLSLAGFAINVVTGSMFLMTDPDQYIYNPAFHFKLLFLMLAGVNVLVFYLVTFRWMGTLGPESDAPYSAKVAGAASLICWTGVITCGRLLTFYRPALCRPDEIISVLATCIIR